MKNRSCRETLRCHIPFGTPSGFFTLVFTCMCNLSFKKKPKHGTVFVMEIIHFCLNHSLNRNTFRTVRLTSEFQVCNSSCSKLFNPYT